MSLLGFPFTSLKVVVGRPGYRIDSHTIKRGFWLASLITSSYGAQSFAYFAYTYCFLVFLLVRFVSLLLALQQAQFHQKRNSYASSIAFSSLGVLPVSLL